MLSSSVATVGETTGTRLKQDRLPCLFNLYKSKCCTIPPSSLAQALVLVAALVSPSWACSAACGAPPTRTARRRGRSAQGACQRASCSQETHLYVGVLLLLGLHAAHEEAGVHLAAGEVEQLHVLHSSQWSQSQWNWADGGSTWAHFIKSAFAMKPSSLEIFLICVLVSSSCGIINQCEDVWSVDSR